MSFEAVYIIGGKSHILSDSRAEAGWYGAFAKYCWENNIDLYFSGWNESELKLREVARKKKTLFFAIKPVKLSRPIVSELKRLRKDHIVFSWHPDISDRIDVEMRRVAGTFDEMLFVFTDKEVLGRIEDAVGVPCGTIMNAVDIANYFTYYTSLGLRRRQYDVSFIGSYDASYRRKFYLELSKIRKHIVFGNNWNLCPHMINWAGTAVYSKIFSIAASKAWVSLNPVYNKDIENAFSSRVYRLMASGVPVLSERQKGMDELFKEDEVIFFYDSPEEMKKRVEELLKDKEKLLAVGKTSRREVELKHTYDNRVGEVVEKAKRYEK